MTNDGGASPLAVGFRRLTSDDLPMLRDWLNAPHVYEWWGESSGPGSLGGPGELAASLSDVEAKYGADIEHGSSTHRYVILLSDRPIGLIQWYRLADELDYAVAVGEDPEGAVGLDLLIGEVDAVGRGIGAVVLRAFVDQIVFADPKFTRAMAGPHPENIRSVRAFEKAGFSFRRTVMIPDHGPELVMVRHRDATDSV